MSEDFSDKVRALLEDPDMVAKIAAIAGGLGGGGSTAPSTPANTSGAEVKPPSAQADVAAVMSKLPDALKSLPAVDPRLSLLNSLKPFLRTERQAKLDSLTRALSVANLIGTLGKDKKV